jgi:amino acid adenylation domain-containing protein
LEIPGLTIRPLEIDRGVSQFDLTLMMAESEGRLHGAVEYNSALFEAATIARMFRGFYMLLEDAVAHPDRRIAKLRVLSEAEWHYFVMELNQTRMNYPREKCVHELFEAQAREKPEAIAAIFGDTQLTYRELNRRANALAQQLQESSVGPEVCVGIYMERSLEMVVALLGVLKAGGAYVPIDPAFPKERVQFMLNDANVRVLVANVELAFSTEHETAVINLNDQDEAPPRDRIVSDPQADVMPDNRAYLIYTSGSTGQPKGVMVQHRSLANFLCSMQQRPGIKAGDVLLAVTFISFDIAALELFLPLIAGATVVVASREMTTNPRKLEQAVKNYGVGVMQATPATWRMMLEAGWPGEAKLRALCGGEALTRKLAEQLLERVGSLWNMYGPTETTVWSVAGEVTRGEKPITIGQPIGNTQLYVLDRYLQPAPMGVIGDLHIGGDGVAQGYLNQPELTAEKFIPDPFIATPGACLYKTGDQARYLPDGAIELLGRLDEQVKINGFRIELGEIETALNRHPAIAEAVVIARADRLAAYFVSNEEPAPANSELHDFLKTILPAYMVPATFVPLKALPLTPNGKIDRRALPTPDPAWPATSIETFVAPRTPLEEWLAAIYAQVLGIDKVGIYDNFFDLGGGSIQILQIIARAQEAGLSLTPEMFFEHQTVAELAAKSEKSF